MGRSKSRLKNFHLLLLEERRPYERLSQVEKYKFKCKNKKKAKQNQDAFKTDEASIAEVEDDFLFVVDTSDWFRNDRVMVAVQLGWV